MNEKLILGGMNQKLIEIEEEDCIFYCNNCKNEFDHIISFYPIPGLTEYYNCKFCDFNKSEELCPKEKRNTLPF